MLSFNSAIDTYLLTIPQTVSALTTLFLVMAMHPEVQKRAQADIDRVAPNRLPTLDDYNSLPYVRAIVQELLRWAPVAPLGKPSTSPICIY